MTRIIPQGGPGDLLFETEAHPSIMATPFRNGTARPVFGG